MPLTDKPANDVIDNDTVLDSWYAGMIRTLTLQAGKRAGGSRGLTIPNLLDNTSG